MPNIIDFESFNNALIQRLDQREWECAICMLSLETMYGLTSARWSN